MNQVPIYNIDKNKAKKMLRFLSAASADQHKMQKKKQEEKNRIDMLHNKILALEKTNLSLNSRVLKLSQKLDEIHVMKQKSSEIMRIQEEEEVISKKIEEISEDIEHKEDKVAVLEHKVDAKLKDKRIEDLRTEAKKPIVQDKKRILELEEKVKNKLEGDNKDKLRDKLSKAKALYRRLEIREDIPEKNLKKVLERIQELEKKLGL